MSTRGHKRAFTLVEVLVSVAVIAVLLALALPALSRVRSRAQSARCLATLHDISILHLTFADEMNRGRFANALEPGQVTAKWTLGSTQTITNKTLDQTRQWLGPLAVDGWVGRWLEEGNWYCPAILRRYDSGWETINPQILPHDSYWYSAALFTAKELWDPEHPERREDPDAWRRSVGVHEVTFPERKVLQFESGDFHGSGLRLGRFPAGRGRTNVVCCDGHTTTVDPYAGNPAFEVPWPYQAGESFFEGAMPFSSAAFGFAGTDW